MQTLIIGQPHLRSRPCHLPLAAQLLNPDSLKKEIRWGMGHTTQKQTSFTKTHWRFRYNHGGILRQKRRGRKFRPLSTKTPLHLVFKADRKNQRRGFRSPLGFYISNQVIKKYAKKFFVKVEQAAICQDHIHLIVRFTRRTEGQHFLRVGAGQIAQNFQKNGFLVTDTQSLWKYRPFSRLVLGFKAYVVLRNYVWLNRKEAEGLIPYRKSRLKGLSSSEWRVLWR